MVLEPSFEVPAEPDASRPLRAAVLTRPRGQCKNAGDDTRHRLRPAPYPGPRCATCHREKVKEARRTAKGRQVERRFDLTPEQYDALYWAQGGKCYVCRRATGKRKRLAVDHDHTLALAHGHPVDRGCRKCIRGLACGFCNQYVLGRLGGNPSTYERLAVELRDPYARKLLEEWDSA
jgi:hypothetical protein